MSAISLDAIFHLQNCLFSPTRSHPQNCQQSLPLSDTTGTHGAGVFYLEGLGQGQHWIEINGQRLPNTYLLIQPDSAPFESVNFVMPSQTLEN